jgi:putative protease
VEEDENGTFIFNSRDLCLLEHIPALVASGVHALKIEGRMKGINYVASVLRIYRQALDEFLDNPDGWSCRPEWLGELAKLSHRGYTTGFLFGQPRNVGQEYDSAYIRSHDFVGVVDEVREDGTLLIDVRNRIKAGDLIECIGPKMRSDTLILPSFTILPERGAAVPAEVANPNSRILLTVPFTVETGDLLRREKIVST